MYTQFLLTGQSLEGYLVYTVCVEWRPHSPVKSNIALCAYGICLSVRIHALVLILPKEMNEIRFSVNLYKYTITWFRVAHLRLSRHSTILMELRSSESLPLKLILRHLISACAPKSSLPYLTFYFLRLNILCIQYLISPMLVTRTLNSNPPNLINVIIFGAEYKFF